MSAERNLKINDEVTNILSHLISFDTTNPPGNESGAAEWLAKILGEDGFSCEVLESAPGRGSLVTRLKGSNGKPKLLLLSHLDVVSANASEWTVPPFLGEVRHGYVWGRGALDMKGMTAIEVMALKLLKREGVQFKDDILLAATADEEKGGLGGAEFLLRNYPEKIFAKYVLNEGGGSSVRTASKNVFGVNTAEKGLLWFRVKAKGTPGHGSLPQAADNAIMRINRVVEKLGNFKSDAILSSTVRQLIEGVAAEEVALQEPLKRLLANPEESESVLSELDSSSPAVADEIRPKLRMTVTPTMISGGIKENVIPSESDAVFDCRILPGQTIAQAWDIITKLLADVGLDRLSFETIQAQEPSESPVDTPLFRVIKDVLSNFEPGCGVVPTLFSAGTDSRFFRRRGAVCYGFHPLRSETAYDKKPIRLEHGIDERISVDNLVFGVNVLYETIKRFMT